MIDTNQVVNIDRLKGNKGIGILSSTQFHPSSELWFYMFYSSYLSKDQQTGNEVPKWQENSLDKEHWSILQCLNMFE